MPKQIPSDMVPPERKGIRQISVSPNRATRSPEAAPVESVTPPSPPVREQLSYERPRAPRRGGGMFLWAAAAVVVVALGFAASLFFAGTTLAVTPKQSRPSVDTNFKAFKAAEAGELPFQTVTLEKTDSQAVTASGEEEVSERASGKIIIYNDFGTASQRLIRNTRFETADGKIYRINESVVVPGKKGTIPVSIEVTVFADEPGEAYNLGLMDFTIPGFKGTPQYSKFYARSKTAMAGGFVGKRLTVEPALLAKTKEELNAKLKGELMLQALAEVPEGFKLYEGAIFYDFESLPNTESGTTALIQQKGVLHGLLFEKHELAKTIAIASGSPAEGVFLTIGEDSDLVFTIASADAFEPWEKQSFSFNLKGSAHLIAEFNSEELRRDLAGKSKSALPTVLSGYPAIERAEVIMRPFWRETFPENGEKIKLSTVLTPQE